MSGVFFLGPQPITVDSNEQAVHSNATVSASGSSVFVGFGTKEITLVVNVKASPTGTTPTLQYTLQEVDPGDDTTIFGQTVSTSVINAIGVSATTIRATQGGALKVSWTIGGSSSPTFTQVYATLATKVTTASTGLDGSGVERPVLLDSSGRTEITGTISATNPSVGSNNAAIPTSSTQVGGSDGTNLQVARVFDADSGGGTQFVLGTVLRKSASGGSVEAGTSSDPLRVDPTGTTAQPITDNGGSLTIDSAQLPASLVGGRLDQNVGTWLGSSAPTVGQKNSVNSLPVVLASDQSALSITSPTSGTATLSNVSSSATNVTLLSANASRKGATIQNDSTQVLFVKFGTTASATSYTVRMVPNAYYEVPFGYTGRIDGIWVSANGDARMTEMT